MKFGKFDITLFNFGYFRLDGGSMFGSVPKNLWSKRIPADSENCIRLATRSLVIRSGARLFLVDLGMGDKWSDKEKSIYGIEPDEKQAPSFNPSEVTDIILTHLHFDHAGGISKLVPGSSAVEPCYPKAVVYVQESNLKNAKSPSVKERASYLKDNYSVLDRMQVKLLAGSAEIFPDIWTHRVDGHTTGQQWIEVRNRRESIVFPTDLIPTAHHLPIPFHMGYDNCAGTILKEKQDFLAKASEHNWRVVFQHDVDTPCATVALNDKGHYCVKEVSPLV